MHDITYVFFLLSFSIMKYVLLVIIMTIIIVIIKVIKTKELESPFQINTEVAKE